MINIDNAKEEFIRYRNLFDKDNANIERKYIHTINVMNLSETIAKSLNLNEEEIKLSKLIALFTPPKYNILINRRKVVPVWM